MWISAVFGTEIRPNVEYGTTMYTMRQRIGLLLMRMQKRYRKIETGGEFIDKEIIRAERNSGVVSNKLKKIQRSRTDPDLANANKWKKELAEHREHDLREGFILYKYRGRWREALYSLEEALNSGFEDFKRIRTYLVLANARASPKFDPLLKRFDESFINENAIKSTFEIFNKKQPLCVDTRKQSV
ncbi:unnamed protein product [Vicia faba]|uniref:Uncharacterized protein n=1 Tax=Vicia faba TaxID=3906 RepID=A0AAV0ZX35_VICFA|nr:unnamed protein product [Vicia faba]